MDQPDPQVASDVGPGDHRRHAGLGLGPAGVDRDHVCPGVGGQVHRTVEHPRRGHVVDVELVAQRQLSRLVAGGAGSHSLGDLHRGGADHSVGAGGQHLHRVEDLEVPGAAAQVGAEMAGRLLAGEVGAVALDQRLDPHDDPRRAEAALHCAGRAEGGCVAVALLGTEALGGDDLRSLGFAQGDLACHPGLAVEQHRAASALARRRAAVLGRD